VAGVEGLRDVRGGEFDDDALLALAGVFGIAQTEVYVATEIGAVREDRRDDGLDEGRGPDEPVEEVARVYRLVDERVVVWELQAVRIVHAWKGRRGAMQTHLLGPLLCELVELLALQPERRCGQDKVALFERGPQDVGEDDLGVDTGDLSENVGDVGAVQMIGIDGGVAVWVLFRHRVEGQALDVLGELVHSVCQGLGRG